MTLGMPKRVKRFKRPNINLTQENSENNAKYVNIGEKNIGNWYSLKEKLHFKCDRDFVEYLLGLADKCLRSKLLSQDTEVASDLQCPSAVQVCQIPRQNVDEGGSRILSTVDENMVSLSKKVSDDVPLTLSIIKDREDVETHGNNLRKKHIVITNNDETGTELAFSNDVLSNNGGHTRKVLQQEAEGDAVDENIESTFNTRLEKQVKKRHKIIKNFTSGRNLYDGKMQNESTSVEEKCISPADEELPTEPSRVDDETIVSEETTTTVIQCPECISRHGEKSCPLREPVMRIDDAVTLSDWTRDEGQQSFALASLPDCLELKLVEPKHGLSVFAKAEFQQYTGFGPLIGVPIKEMEIADDFSMRHIWEIIEGKYMTSEDENKSNWLRWLRPAPDKALCNIVPVVFDQPSEGCNSDENDKTSTKQLSFVTISVIKAGEELLFWSQTKGAWASKNMDKTSCGGCNLKFDHSIYYKLHCSVFHEASLSLTVRKYHCKVCGTPVLGKQNIMKHAAMYHNGKGAYQCQFCSKYFLRLNYLEMHRNYGCSANPHRARPLCDYCGRKFCQPQKLKVHIKRMHSDLSEVLREFQCSECLKVLGSRAALQRHNKEVHKRPSSALQQCVKCDKTFQNRSNLKIHMLTHSGVKPFKCQEVSCLAAFTTKQCLQFHYRKVHGLTDGQFPRIVRSVEYTFDAYAGHHQDPSIIDNNATDIVSDKEESQVSLEAQTLCPPGSEEHVQSEECNTYNNKGVASKASKKWMGNTSTANSSDTGDEDDRLDKKHDQQYESQKCSSCSVYCKTSNTCDNNSDCAVNCNNNNRIVVISSSSSKASLLVEAAIDAAEKDIGDHHNVNNCTEETRVGQTFEERRLQEPTLLRPLTPVFYDSLQEEGVVHKSPHNDERRRQWEEEDGNYQASEVVGSHHIVNLCGDEKTSYEMPGALHSSEDESVLQAQNLSLAKRPLAPSNYMYKYHEERNFEESVDMSRSSNAGIMYHHHPHHSSFVRYPTSAPSSMMYDQHYAAAAYHHTEVLRVISLAHSHSLATNNSDNSDSASIAFRHHHQMIPASPPPPPPPPPPPHPDHPTDSRLIISPPEGYQTYPVSPPSYLSPKSHSPITYHHYSGYY